jgi:ubiquitin-conjugating enzyme E2 Q
MDDRYYEVHPPKNPLAPILMTDALQGPATEASFPLLAMQFALRHLVRCTEFCLVCHSRVSTDFEALKPYVCSNPLCLYQYMSLGFGPSIEHEIVSLPTVVDLLVSFCYTSAKASKLKDFPVGMDLKVPSVNSQTWKVNYYGNKGEFLFDDADNDMRSLLKEGDWIIIPVPGTASSEEWHARITETCYYPTVKIAQPVGSQLVGSKSTPGTSLNSVQGINSPSLSGKQTPDNSVSGGIFGADDGEMKEVTFKIYDTSFDDLPDDEKRKTIINILNTLPRVAEMKEWLQKNTNVGDEASLRKWRARISPTALGVLRWIIASNRSCIVPLDESEENPASGFLPVQGMGEWKQFRFAMGAPDKEQRFVSSVKQAHQRLNLQCKFHFEILHHFQANQLVDPSLFAFHGSPLQNWHSIIREGLHFKETAHGRAFGHGCYHSLDLGTSIGYSSVMPHGMSGQVAGYWPQSELKITTALSLNEIVNSPNEFVSKVSFPNSFLEEQR